MKKSLRRRIVILTAVLVLLPFMLPGIIMTAGVFFRDGKVTFSILRETFSDLERTLLLLKNSLLVMAGAELVSLGLGGLLGFIAFRTKTPLRKFLVITLILASCLPLYVVMSSWMAVFGKEFLMYRVWASAWIMGIALVPLVSLLMGIYFSSSDRILEEQALHDTGALGVLKHVTIPQALWGILLAALIVLILGISETTVTDVLTIRTFGEEVRTQFALSFKPWTAAATALPLLAINFVLGLMVLRWIRTRGEATLEGFGGEPLKFHPGKLRIPLTCAVLLLVTAFFLSPSLF